MKKAYDSKMIFTISARTKDSGTPVLEYLENYFPGIPYHQIDSVFGFVEPCTLYGGRRYYRRQLSDEDIEKMESAGIGVRIPLSNHYAERKEYESYSAFLDKYHRKKNSVIVTNDKLAVWIKNDFPKYKIEASIIKNIDSLEKIDEALKIHDTVVLPMHFSREYEFLKNIDTKEHITLFANAACGITCRNKICYYGVSEANKLLASKKSYARLYARIRDKFTTRPCAQKLPGKNPSRKNSKKKKRIRERVYFDLDKLTALGFYRFKLLTSRPFGGAGVAENELGR